MNPDGTIRNELDSPLIPLFVVFDLDGTLADDSHRRCFLERRPKAWPEYFAACDRDLPIRQLIRVLNDLSHRGSQVEIWTGRSADVQAETERWLTANHVAHDRLRMRPSKDYRSQTELKAEWLAEASRKPDLVFDDNMTAVRWWREHGILTAALTEEGYGS